MVAEDVTVMNLNLTKITLAILCIASLSACGKKKGNSAVAAAPAGYMTCTTGINPYTQQPCQIGTQIYAGAAGTSQVCTTGINPYTQQPCQIGTPIIGQQQPYGYGQQPGYGQQFGGGYGGGNPCQQYQYQYGVPYFPQMTQYGMMCVRAG